MMMNRQENDIISRQALIQWIETECNPYGKPTIDYKSGIKVIKHLERIPSAQPKWIPVTERLPEEYQKAICTNKHNEMMIGTYTNFGWMFPCYFEKPIAWMPLPDPYTEEESWTAK